MFEKQTSTNKRSDRIGHGGRGAICAHNTCNACGMTITIKSPKSKLGGKAKKEFAAALALPPEALRLVQQARHRGAAIDSWVIHGRFLLLTVLHTREVPRKPTDARLVTGGHSLCAPRHARADVSAPPLRKRPTPGPHSSRHIPSLIGIIGQVLRNPAELGLMSLDATARRYAAALKLPHDLDLTAAAKVRAGALIRGAAAEARAAAERAAAGGGIKGVKEPKAPPMSPNQVRDRRTDGRTDGRMDARRTCVRVCPSAHKPRRYGVSPRFATNARRASP